MTLRPLPPLPLLLPILLWFPLAAPAAGTTVYRCGNSYSEQPCEQGRVVPLVEGPSEAQRAQAQQNGERDAQLAEELQRRRLHHEAQPVASGGIRFVPRTEEASSGDGKPSDKQKRKQKRGKRREAAGRQSDDDFEAIVPGAAGKTRH
ncbi:hypothetical protein [Caldimonas brevitalea]|uniref:DUF4124 domain-containing protein n=1 Tax=Caldimonas brevitalea TaxID=413882 RepID=A0A0G3BIA8_9BURK|nr:hypothetical protein [Caldimonas brevitalea]AKJ27728.1 hypothetical protein AAW51_1037 [Caldimonas brevitalea]